MSVLCSRRAIVLGRVWDLSASPQPLMDEELVDHGGRLPAMHWDRGVPSDILETIFRNAVRKGTGMIWGNIARVLHCVSVKLCR